MFLVRSGQNGRRAADTSAAQIQPVGWGGTAYRLRETLPRCYLDLHDSLNHGETTMTLSREEFVAHFQRRARVARWRRWERWLIGIAVAIATSGFLLAAAFAGNYESSNFGGVAANPSSRPGGFGIGPGGGGMTPQQQYKAQQEAKAKGEQQGLAGFVDNTYRNVANWAGGFFGGKTSLGQVDYSAPSYGIGYSSFGSGSGGTAGSGSGGTAGT